MGEATERQYAYDAKSSSTVAITALHHRCPPNAPQRQGSTWMWINIEDSIGAFLYATLPSARSSTPATDCYIIYIFMGDGCKSNAASQTTPHGPHQTLDPIQLLVNINPLKNELTVTSIRKLCQRLRCRRRHDQHSGWS